MTFRVLRSLAPRVFLAALLAAALAACSDKGGTPAGAIDAAGGHSPDAAHGAIDATPGTPDAPPPGTPDAPLMSTIDGGHAPGADGGPGVTCGTLSCISPTPQCCVTGITTGMPSFSCIGAADLCTGGTSATCDGPEDCMGHACCGSLAGVSCGTGATCIGGAQLCHTANDCPSMQKCCPSPVGGGAICSAIAAPGCI